MEGLHSVNWSQLFRQGSVIPHDVTFNIVVKNESSPTDDKIDDMYMNKNTYDQTEDSVLKESPKLLAQLRYQISESSWNKLETTPAIPDAQTLSAHKLLLSTVSPVFRRQFYGSLPEGEVVDIKDSSMKAFKLMLGYVYQNTDEEGLEDLVDIHDLLDVFYLAEKYEVLGLKQKVLNRIAVMTVDSGNYCNLVGALLDYSHFEDVIESRVINFIKHHDNSLELVNGAIDSENDDIKQEVITKLITFDDKSILETIKAAHDLLTSEGCNLDEKETMKSVLTACVKGYEAVLKDSIKFSQFIPDPDSHLQDAFSLLHQYWKNKLCVNCGSAACKKGEKVKASQAKVGCCVLVDGVRTGVVSEVGLKKVDKIRARELSAFCDGSTYQYDAYCPVCIMNWFSVEAAKSCDCVHSDGHVGSSRCEILLDSGIFVTKDYRDIVFDCN